MPPSADAPTGRTVGAVDPTTRVTSWAAFAHHVREYVPELTGPRQWATYDRMLTDAEIDSHVTGTFLPLEEYVFWIDLNGCDPAQAQPLADDLGLPTGDRLTPQAGATEPWRAEDAFDFRDHLHEALNGVLLGGYMFELEGDNRREGGGRTLWRLDGIYPRHPSTVREIHDDPRTGRLEGIRQTHGLPRRENGLLFAYQPPQIPAVRLVPYVWRPDAKRRWTGRPLLRALFRDWMLKDVLIRVDVTNHERAGGVPWVKTDERWDGQNLDDLQQLASNFRVDEEGGAALPPGAELVLARIAGTDVVASMRYHDEQIAKVWHQMVRELGQTQTGSRALGESFGDLEALARRAIAAWACRTFTRRFIFRWWEWNYGRQATAPILRASPPAIEGSDEDPVEQEAAEALTAIAARTGGQHPTRAAVKAAADGLRVARLGPEWRGCAT